MPKSCRSLHIWTGSSHLRCWIPRSLQALPLQNVCLRRQRFSGTYASAGYWWIHWPPKLPKTVQNWRVFLSNRCTFIVVHLSASLHQADPVKRLVTGSLKVRDWQNEKNLTKWYNLTTFVFFSAEREATTAEKRVERNVVVTAGPVTISTPKIWKKKKHSIVSGK